MRFRPGRLLKVAKALRESKHPEKFQMNIYGHSCRTPACAFGHYAHRTDLQKLFKLDRDGAPVLVEKVDGFYQDVDFFDKVVLEHFGIDSDEARELFSERGCNRAQTALEAAAYIEGFVREKKRDGP